MLEMVCSGVIRALNDDFVRCFSKFRTRFAQCEYTFLFTNVDNLPLETVNMLEALMHFPECARVNAERNTKVYLK